MEKRVLKLLSIPTNQSILSALAVEPSYPRQIARRLDMRESDVARRLRQMEKEGLVRGQWVHDGGNMKVYRLTIDRLLIRFGPDGLGITVGDGMSKEGASTKIRPVEHPIPVSTGFVGRKQELTDLAGSDPVHLVLGLPGIGKTSLVAQHAAMAADGRSVFWYGCRGVESLNWLANRVALYLASNAEPRLLHALEHGVEPAEKRALLVAALDNPGGTFVFDDVHRIEDEAVKEILIDACRNNTRGRLVLTSREPLPVQAEAGRVHILQLDGLTDADVAEYLREKDVTGQDDLIPRLREQLGGHPLAMNLLVETAKTHEVPLVEVLERLPKGDLEIYLLQEVYETLREDERRVMTLASLFRTRFIQEDLQAITSRPVTSALLRLRRRLLVQTDGDTYAIHETLRHFFYKQAADRKHLHERIAERYLENGTDEGRLEAMHHLLAADRRDRVLELLETNLDLREFEAIDAGYHDLYYSVLERFRREDVPMDRRWGLIEDEKGDILYHRGECEAALTHYQEALKIFEKSNDRSRAADVCWKQALAHARLERNQEARTACAAGLKLAPIKSRERDRLASLAQRLEQDTALQTSRTSRSSQAGSV